MRTLSILHGGAIVGNIIYEGWIGIVAGSVGFYLLIISLNKHNM